MSTVNHDFFRGQEVVVREYGRTSFATVSSVKEGYLIIKGIKQTQFAILTRTKAANGDKYIEINGRNSMHQTFNITGGDFDFLLGKSIISYDNTNMPSVNSNYSFNEMLTSSDGTQILITENEGCGGCHRGWSELESLDVLVGRGLIVEVDTEYESDFDSFTITFKFSDGTSVTVKGSDGDDNGYYGQGFHTHITRNEH